MSVIVSQIFIFDHNQILGRGMPATRSGPRTSFSGEGGLGPAEAGGRRSASRCPRQAPRSSIRVCSWRSLKPPSSRSSRPTGRVEPMLPPHSDTGRMARSSRPSVPSLLRLCSSLTKMPDGGWGELLARSLVR
eukprot:1232877-Pleurochrysis_carterae.AAC.1